MTVGSCALAPRCVAFLFASAVIIAGLPAQEKPLVVLPEEAEVMALGARELSAFATSALKNGFPVRARVVWLEVLAEYDRDDAVARKELGYVRTGTAWQRDPAFVFPEHDQPAAAAAKQLEQRWLGIAGKLGAAHGALAAKLQTAGKADRARHHAQRTLRFVPGDGKAMALVGARQFEGVTVDELDLSVLQRSRLMDKAIARLHEQAFPSQVVDEKLAMLDALGSPYVTVKSANFTVHGDHDAELLHEAAAHAERALAFCTEAFAGCEGFPSLGKQCRRFVFLQERAQWNQLVRTNAARNDVDFLIENTSSTRLKDVETAVSRERDMVLDLAVRWVAKDFVGVHSDALEEGVGHAVVGMFFGRNLVFVVGRDDPQGTVTSAREKRKLMLPDIETWRELAIELAFQDQSTPAAKLPLLKAAEFPTDARIKAWSFVDYLLRADPTLLLKLEAAGAKAGNEQDVTNSFQERTGKGLPELEGRWRRFWSEDTPLRRAVVGKTTPLEAASKDAPAWLSAFNQLRTECGQKPVGWSAQLSIACKQHVDYLKANKDQRGPVAEHTQRTGKVFTDNAGRIFATTAVVWTRDVKKAVEAWMAWPGYRDAVLNANIDTVGIYADGSLMVLDASRGREAKREVVTQVWPESHIEGRAKDPVPAAVDVESLGPEVVALLTADQRGKQKQVGWPLTLHCYHSEMATASCEVECQGKPVAGYLVRAKGNIRRTSAPGLWVFYAKDPWPKGVPITAKWEWVGGKHTVTFVAE